MFINIIGRFLLLVVLILFVCLLNFWLKLNLFLLDFFNLLNVNLVNLYDCILLIRDLIEVMY